MTDQHPEDDRTDDEKRDRIDELVAYVKRNIRRLYVGSIIVVVGLSILLWAVWVAFGQIQSSRERASFDSCLRDWRHNKGIHDFIFAPPLPGIKNRTPPAGTQLGDDLRRRTNAYFPLVAKNERDARVVCRQKARERTSVG